MNVFYFSLFFSLFCSTWIILGKTSWLQWCDGAGLMIGALANIYINTFLLICSNKSNDQPIILPPISSLDVRFSSNTPNRSNVSTSLPSPPMTTAIVPSSLACFDQQHHYYPSSAAPYIQPKPTINTKELASHRRMQEDMDNVSYLCRFWSFYMWKLTLS